MTDKTYIMTDVYFKHQLKQIVHQPLKGDRRDYEAGLRLISILVKNGQIISDLYSHYVNIVKEYTGVE